MDNGRGWQRSKDDKEYLWELLIVDRIQSDFTDCTRGDMKVVALDNHAVVNKVYRSSHL